MEIILRALEESNNLLIIIGSAFSARTERNPFTYMEVIVMITSSLTAEQKARVAFSPVMDTLYNLAEWQTSVQNAVRSNLPSFLASDKKNVALIGHAKDSGTQFYLKLFPQWSSIGVENFHDNLSATNLRDMLFNYETSINDFSRAVPKGTLDFLKSFVKTTDYDELCKEIAYYKEYRAAHEEASQLIATKLGYKSDIKFQTVDACVVQSGNILLIQRKNFPGRNLWALPGGFVDQGESLAAAVIRELKEETRLKVPEPVLWGSLVTNKVFDYPHRSARGRVITQAYLFNLAPSTEMPKVNPRSDAKEAQWIPIGDIKPELMFEDHAQIITNLLGEL